MKKQNNFLLWISFFLTTAITFGCITIPSYIYWSRSSDPLRTALIGTAGALLFGIIYASYKLKTLHGHQLELDFTGLETDPRERMTKELRRLGYREVDGIVFPAGFRADYYMAPDIKIEVEENRVTLFGPKFYVIKLFKRHRRFRKRLLKKIGQLTDSD